MIKIAQPAATPAPASSLDIVTPGERLGSTSTHLSGTGTHVLDSSIFASITGVVLPLPPTTSTSLPSLSVSALRPPAVLPQPGDVVLARVTKINARYASLSILCIGARLTADPFPAVLRQRDIRSFDVDACDVGRSYRPGDIVRATVLSLGDARSYFVSTAEAELGVVEATSAAGGKLRPLSWERMECALTGQKEYRKVAKPPGSAEDGQPDGKEAQQAKAQLMQS